MKNNILLVLLMACTNTLFGQVKYDKNKEYNNLDEALRNPEKIFKLNLSNQTVPLTMVDWSKFINLEYLSLKNDHLKEIPLGITRLKTLRTIDLSGNNFNNLPSDFDKLTELEEVFLNDESNMNVPKTLETLAKLPNLKTLHLENDNLQLLPSELLQFRTLENLYLGNNDLKRMPALQSLDHLKYLDLKGNQISPEFRDMQNMNFGLKINF